jgi:Peptidase family M28
MRRDTFLAIGVLILILAALAAKSLLLSVPPVRSAAGEFSAGRAKARLAYILGDERPHPADSVGDDLVRARLVTVLQQMGLKPIVRDQFVCNDFQKARLVACARVRNVIAVVGPPTGKALVLSAHYDSVPVGPGASDDGIGVATMLEVGSILKDRPLARRVILLFNEGEELGLIGARGFLADPLSRSVDSLLNFEARGVNGPVTMFETSQSNGAAIAAYAAAVKHPYASSLSTDVARLIPNDTDVTTYKERGWLTLNSAIVGNETRYHSPGDNLAGLDPRSLQDMGDEALAVTSELSTALPHASGNRIFFDVSQRVFVQMPLWAGVLCLLVLLAGFAAIAWSRRAPLRSTAIVLAAIVSGSLLAWLAVTIASFLSAGVYWRAHPEITFLAIYATTLLGELAILRTLGRRLEPRQLRPAFWLVFLILGGALALAAPGGIIDFLFPAAAVLIGTLLRPWYAPSELIGGLIGVLLLYLTWGELLAALEELFSPGPLWIAAPVAAIMIVPVLIEAQPLFEGAGRRITMLGSACLAALVWAFVAAAPAYSQDHQQRFTIEHLTQFPSRRSSWSILNDGNKLPPAYSGFGPWHRGKLDFSERQRWLAKAPAASGIEPPSIQVVEALNHGSERNIRLRLQSNGAERILLVAPAEAHIQTAGVAGFIRPIASEDSSGRFTIACTGRRCDGAELSIDLNSAAPVQFTIVGARNGLPVAATPLVRARPQFARPQYTPDETVTIAHVKL